MPGRNGTGPLGKGPGTGRGMGWCSGLFSRSGRRGVIRSQFPGALISLAGVIIRDIFNPNGILRSFGTRIIAKQSATPKIRKDADFRVIDNNRSENRF